MKRLRNLRKSSIERTPNSLFHEHPHIVFLSIVFFVSALVAFTYISSQKNSHPPQTSSLGLQSISKGAQISAFVGEFRFTLTGFTSPGARVVLEGLGIYDETYADNNGQFTFYNRFSPLSPREACLTAYDTDGRMTNPLCLPPFSVRKDVRIGPVLLPPSVSVNQGQYAKDDFGILTGKGAPESIVDIDLYADSTAQKLSLTAQTDETGSYSLTLPTEHENEMRIFSVNRFKEYVSDKSNTLTLAILPFWRLVVRQFGLFLKGLLPYMLPIILFLEGLFLLIYFLYKPRGSKYPLALRPQHTLMNVISRLPAIKKNQELTERVS